MTESIVIDFPQPDSPTRATVSPGRHFEVDALDHLHRTAREMEHRGQAPHRQYGFAHGVWRRIDAKPGRARISIGADHRKSVPNREEPSRGSAGPGGAGHRRDVARKLMDRQEAEQGEGVGLLGTRGNAELVDRRDRHCPGVGWPASPSGTDWRCRPPDAITSAHPVGLARLGDGHGCQRRDGRHQICRCRDSGCSDRSRPMPPSDRRG